MNVDDSKQESSSESEDEDYTLLRKLATMDLEDRPQLKYEGTGFSYVDVFAEHKCEWDPAYPEGPQRVLQPLKRCQELGLVQRCKQIEPHFCPMDVIVTKHSEELVELAESTATMTQAEHMQISEKYDAWYCNKHTYEAALAAAGSVISLTENIINGKITNGFGLVRPPGHHAQEGEFNGYCTFNNVALAAQCALDSGLKKILIVDWDVHHGQGIQQMFYDDPRVMYISIHRYEYGNFWPNLLESDYDHIGEDDGKGFNINIPLNKTGLTNADYLAILHQVILPLGYEFGPQLVLVSSGFDAAIGDEKGEMLLTPSLYAHMTHHLMALASGRICVALEGGYCLESLSEGCALTLRALLSDPCPAVTDTGEPTDSVAATILNVVKVLRSHWTCFAHYKTAGRSHLCPFKDVNNMPPVEGVEFCTAANRPDKYDLSDYPLQDEMEYERLRGLIQNLIKETDLSSAHTRCSYVFDADMRAHKLENHPEQPDRISAIYNRLAEYKLLKRLLTVPSRLARQSEILWIHEEDYIEDLVSSQKLSQKELDEYPRQKIYNSVYMNQKSLHCALLSCGSVLNLVEAILTNQTQSGVAIVRPPGHHAECSRAMGFCFFNNVAVAAKMAQHKFGVKRILILDWDIHHGNATQHQFYDDPSVLYISLHRFDGGWFFPGSQDANLDRCGEGPGLGYNVNIPWAGGRMGDAEYITAFTQIVMPIAYQFSPELVLVSAGFDAAIGDPLGGYKVSPAAYGHMTHMLMGLANGRVALALEGGYNLTAISEAMAVCTSVLLGEPCPMLGPLVACHSAAVVIGAVMEEQKEYWSCLKYKVVIPSVRQVEGQRWEKEKGALQERLSNKSAKSKAVTSEAGDNNQQRRLPEHVDNRTAGATENGDATCLITEAVARVDISDDNRKTEVASAAPRNDSANNSEDRNNCSGDTPKPSQTFPTSCKSNVTKSRVDASGGARPKTQKSSLQQRDIVTPEFQSTIYDGEPDDHPLSIFGGRSGVGDIMKGVNRENNEAPVMDSPSDADNQAAGCSKDAASSSQCAAASSPDSLGAMGGGACGGVSSRPNTVEEFLQMQGSQQMYAVTPLSWCPHLPEVAPLPPQSLDAFQPCETCGDTSENWVCLTCYQVHCSRFVNEHMLFHRLETEHNLVLSYSDISVWCYACESYIDNEVLLDAKNAAHKSKFGEPLPGQT